MNLAITRTIFIATMFLFLSDYAVSSQTLSPADIVDRYSKAVVVITTIKGDKEISLGSGFIVKSDGVIITNYHVVKGAYPAQIKIKNGDIYDDVNVINVDSRKDIAVIKISAFNLPIVPLGNSDNVRVGEKVVVIGNPHGFELTVSDGLLSQIRDTGIGYSLHQISAPISPGSSGSPVFNQKGEVIGIATLSDTKGQNLNFSVPINYVRGLIDGTAKYSLREMAANEKGNTVDSKVTQIEFVEEIEAFRIFGRIIEDLKYSLEECFNILQDSGIPIDDNLIFLPAIKVSSLIQKLKIDNQELGKIDTRNSNTEYFISKLLSIIPSSLELLNKMQSAVSKLVSDSNGRTYHRPDYQMASTATVELGTVLGQIDNQFMIKYVELIKNKYQSLEPLLLPAFIYAFDSKDKPSDELIEQTKLVMGKMGIVFRSSTRNPVVWYVEQNGPAAKAGIKRDDVILGLVSGRIINTQMDYRNFQIGTKPGDFYTFRVRRDFRNIEISVRMY